MPYTTYIITNDSHNFYVGMSTCFHNRMKRHRAGETAATNKGDLSWRTWNSWALPAFKYMRRLELHLQRVQRELGVGGLRKFVAEFPTASPELFAHLDIQPITICENKALCFPWNKLKVAAGARPKFRSGLKKRRHQQRTIENAARRIHERQVIVNPVVMTTQKEITLAEKMSTEVEAALVYQRKMDKILTRKRLTLKRERKVETTAIHRAGVAAATATRQQQADLSRQWAAQYQEDEQLISTLCTAQKKRFIKYQKSEKSSPEFELYRKWRTALLEADPTTRHLITNKKIKELQ